MHVSDDQSDKYVVEINKKLMHMMLITEYNMVQ